MKQNKLFSRRIIITSSIAVCFLQSCFFIDENISKVKMSSNNIEEFIGVFENSPCYSSKSSTCINMDGSCGDYRTAKYIKLSVVSGDELEMIGFDSNCVFYNNRLFRGKNYLFDDGKIIIKTLSDFRGDPGLTIPSIGFYHSEWLLNENSDLVKVTKSGGIGIFVVIPVAGGGESMTIHKRVNSISVPEYKCY